MKIGSAVVGLSAAAFCIFSLTGCVTTESQGSGQGAGARHRGIVKHQHKGKETPAALTKEQWEDQYGPADSNNDLYGDDSMLMGSSDMGDSSMVEPAPAAVDYGTTEVYIVKKGDVLSQIAVDFDTTTANLIDMNGLSNPDVLYVGQELRVPAGRGGAKTTTKSTGPVKSGGVYIIQKGDTLSGIALAAGVSVDDLRSVNGIKGDMIMAGEELKIPDYGKVPSSTKKVTGTSSKTKSEPKPEPQPEPAPAPALAPAEPAPAEDPMSYDEPVVEPAPAAMDIGIVEDKVLYPGETLDDVARQYGVSKAEIMRMNNISDESQVREGQRLRIPIAE